MFRKISVAVVSSFLLLGLLPATVSGAAEQIETDPDQTTQSEVVNSPEDLSRGDEFNGDTVNKNWVNIAQDTSALNEHSTFLYAASGISVKDGNLEVITERHCLASGQEPDASNVQTAPCTDGLRTVYTSGRIQTGDIYNAPFKMEVRAKMAANMKKQGRGMHLAAWMVNNQPFCSSSVMSSTNAEIDTMELYGDKVADTRTSHVSCSTNESGKSVAHRDYHTVKTTVAGEWHTYSVVWNGYSIEYFFDGRPVPQTGSTETKTTSETVGLSQEEFRSVLNDNPWKIIIDNRVFPDNSFRKPPNNSKAFEKRVDLIDYVRLTPLKDVYPQGKILSYWMKSGGAKGRLGAPIGSEISVNGGSYQDFEGGRIVYNGSREQVFSVKDGVLNEYKSVKGTEGVLGFPVSEEKTLKGGSYQTFEHGKIHWSAATHGHYTNDAVQKYWAAAKWEKGWLGFPKADPISVDGGVSQAFDGGIVFWNSKSGKSFAVKGGIKTAYAAQGWEQGSLGFPVREEGSVKGGASQRFEHGVIFWSTKIKKAYAVMGETLTKYASAKYEQGVLGFPVSEVKKLADGTSQAFEHGQVHWSEASGAHVTGGGVQNYWSRNGWEKGSLGYPTGDELKVPGGVSQGFQGGTVFWNSKQAKAFTVKDEVRDAYRFLKWERGLLGLPTSEVRSLEDGGVSQSFEHGQIHWSQSTGGFATTGAIQTYWSKQGWEKGWLGYPTSNEVKTSTGATQSFQGGTLTWNAKKHIVSAKKK